MGRYFGIARAVAACALALSAGNAWAEGCSLREAILPVTMDGLRASVPVKVNGQPTTFWLDSGAWFSTMSGARATDLGLKISAPLPNLQMYGIGGEFTARETVVKTFGILNTDLHDLEFLVGGSDTGNTLIGRNILLSAGNDLEFNLAGGEVKLVWPHGCANHAMTYWAPGKPYFTVPLRTNDRGDAPLGSRVPSRSRIPDIQLPVRINQTMLNAELDSGAESNLISRRAAERAGIDLKGPEAEPIEGIGGFGRHYARGWSVKVDSISIGDETVLHGKLTVIDGPIVDAPDAPDMLLGMPYLLTHHLYLAREQHLIYFTYGGGDPFPGKTAHPGLPMAAKKPAVAPAGAHLAEAIADQTEPTTADGFARRGAARLAQSNTAAAIADFTAAITLDPQQSRYFSRRAQAEFEAKNPQAGRTDLDRAIALAPNDPQLLRQRALLRHRDHDEAGALADADAAASHIARGSLDADAIAGLYLVLGQAGRAIPIFDALVSTHGEDARLAGLLNGACWARGLANVELATAQTQCARALKLSGNAADVEDSAALVLFRRGDYAGALALYDKVLAANPKQSWSRYLRGLTWLRLGHAEGKAECEAAVANDAGVAERAKAYGLMPS